jgi:predicted N-acetyltransferase YhbS
MSLEIVHLFERPEHLRLVAGWIYDEFWTDKPGYSVETFVGLLGDARGSDRIPLSLLALWDGAPAGTVNLVACDSRRRPDLTPWLAALVVVPELRRRGIGAALVRRLCGEAKRLGCGELYLGADIPAYYEPLGARVFESYPDNLCIMRVELGGGTTADG